MRREYGILVHPSSLPGPHGIGDLGEGAFQFVDWLASVGARLWQILPLVPPGAGNSPYSTWSAYAGNPALISLDELTKLNLLPPTIPFSNDGDDRIDFERVTAFKQERLEFAAKTLLSEPEGVLYGQYQSFVRQNPWVRDAATFRAVKSSQGEQAWWSWPEGLKNREPAALADATETLRDSIELFCVIQFFFQLQWNQLREHCQESGVEILGDMPIYVDADSVDVWCDQTQFQLDANGKPSAVAGVPPDAFSATGQLWGNPLYDWDKMSADGYQWWIRRLKRALELADRVRIDHFRGLSAYWAVPAGSADAQSGEWRKGPGAAFFEAVRKELGDNLPIVAEDLGTIDDDVVALVKAADVPNMLVLQFAFGGESDNWYLPHNHGSKSVVYTGTHDNDTSSGWWQHADEKAKHHVRMYFGTDGHDISWTLIRSALASVAETAIIPIQDVLSLDSSARMNTPSVGLGNWGWQMQSNALDHGVTDRLRTMADLYGRLHT